MDRPSFDESFHAHPYVHPVYAPGQWVYIHPDIRNIHEKSLGAGKRVQVVSGISYSSDDPLVQEALERDEEILPHLKKVPVTLDGHIWYVEEEYVFPGEEVPIALKKPLK